MIKSTSIFPYVGGKWRCQKIIQPLIPEHDIYIEPFAGSLATFFHKDPAKIEVINDLNKDIINFFEVLINKKRFDKLLYMLKNTPYSIALYEKLRKAKIVDKTYRAYQWFCIARMSHGGMKPNSQKVILTSGWRYSKGKSNTYAKEIKQFHRSINNLKYFRDRLLNVYLECSDYKKILLRWVDKNTFIFVDPPYYNLNYYKYNFNLQDHNELKTILESLKCKIMITYNDCEEIRKLYNDDRWNIFVHPVASSTQDTKKNHIKVIHNELIIMNYQENNLFNF